MRLTFLSPIWYRTGMATDDQGTERHSRISTSFDSAKVKAWLKWGPGFVLPDRFSAKIDGDWLPCRVELELAASDRGVHCVALRLESRDAGEPVTASGLRGVPLGECIRLATAAMLRPAEHKPDELRIQLGPHDLAETTDLASRRPQRRIPRDWLQEAADIYLSAPEHPTQAVERQHSQAPITYSTARRWVAEARQLGLIPKTTPGRASTRKEQQ